MDAGSVVVNGEVGSIGYAFRMTYNRRTALKKSNLYAFRYLRLGASSLIFVPFREYDVHSTDSAFTPLIPTLACQGAI